MARLPDPKVTNIEVTWDEGYKDKQNIFYQIIGQAIRKRHLKEKGEKDDKPDD